MNEHNTPATFTAEDKEHLDWVYTLHKYGVPVAAAALVLGVVWWRSKQAGSSFR